MTGGGSYGSPPVCYNKEKTVKRRVPLHILLTVMSVTVSLALQMIPGAAEKIISMLIPALLFSVSASVLCGTVYGCVTALLVPLFSWLLFRENTAADMIIFASMLFPAALCAGICSRIFTTAIGAAVTGSLSGLIGFGISHLAVSFYTGRTYTIGNFVREGILDIWPGLILCLVLVPLFSLAFEKMGLLSIQREDRRRIHGSR